MAEDPELLAQVLAALDTQVGGDLPIAYHLVDIARGLLRVGARRDAAADIPIPDMKYISDAPPNIDPGLWAQEKDAAILDWWQKFCHHARLVVANRNMHSHQGSCLSGKRGKQGCRFNAPWPHDIHTTRCVELSIEDRDDSIEYRCRNCYACGALMDTSLMEETRSLKVLEADQKRDLYYTVAAPTLRAETGDDARVLAIDIKRGPLATLDRVKTALAEGVTSEYIANLRRVLLETITGDGTLPRLLEKPELKLVRDRLMELTTLPISGEDDVKVILSTLLQYLCLISSSHPSQLFIKHYPWHKLQGSTTLLSILRAWTADTLTCRNSIIADYSLVLSGCTRGNAVPYSLGAGSGSKSASLYQIKYMGKDCVEISASATMLIDAYEHIKQFPSSAEDAGSDDRRAIHFCQRVINTGGMELEGLQAAGVVLDVQSSGASDGIEYYSGWEILRLARIAAKGHTGDIDFRNEELDNDGMPLYNRDVYEDDESNAEPEILSDMASEVMQSIAADSTVDLLDKFHGAQAMDTEGYAQVYRTSQNENVPVSSAHHYMHRDAALWRFSAFEFARLFKVRAMNKNDEKWYNAAIRSEQQAASCRGRVCERFLLVAPHPLHSSHILVPRAKLGIPAFAGTPPPSDSASGISNSSTTIMRERFADFFVSNFIPWSAANPPILSYSTWVDHVNILEDEACLRNEREPDILPTTSQDDVIAIESARCSRLIAAGRLNDIENCTNCFKTKKESVVLLGKHRARARALWNQNGVDMPYDESASAQNYQASILIQKLRDKAERMKCPQDLVTRQDDAHWASEWSKELGTALRLSQDHRTMDSESLPRLQSVWNKAAHPRKRTLEGGIRNPRDVAKLLKQPIVLDDTADWFSTAITPAVPTITYETTSDISLDDDPFADITEIAYGVSVDTHKRLGLPLQRAPLNPEQRACGRDFLKVALLRKERKAQGFSHSEIRDEIYRLGLHQVTMMIGYQS